jgi:hypothetical protein
MTGDTTSLILQATVPIGEKRLAQTRALKDCEALADLERERLQVRSRLRTLTRKRRPFARRGFALAGQRSAFEHFFSDDLRLLVRPARFLVCLARFVVSFVSHGA